MPSFESPIYLDYAASSPLHPLVASELTAYASGNLGNPSSTHLFGRRARADLDLARDRVANFLHCDPARITFTSGGTEAANLAIFGAALQSDSRRTIVVSSVEHHAVLYSAQRLAQLGYDVKYIPVDADCRLDMDYAASVINDQTAIVSVMHANNESGTLFPVKKLAKLAHSAGALFHTDAVQTVPVLPVVPDHIGADLLSISSHKIAGPPGVGALYVARGVKLVPQLYGGPQERERRAGTENVPGIIGFGKAAEITGSNLSALAEAADLHRQAFLAGLDSSVSYQINAENSDQLPTILNIHFPGVDAELLLMRLDGLGIAVSSGAACASGSLEPSHVLLAMGLDRSRIKSSIRVSFGQFQTQPQCRLAAETISRCVLQMQKSPVSA